MSFHLPYLDVRGKYFILIRPPQIAALSESSSVATSHHTGTPPKKMFRLFK